MNASETPEPDARKPNPATMPIELRGYTLQLSYLHTSRGAETLLYLHGLGSSKEDFLGAWQVPEWANFTLAAFDAPGCGATGGYRHGVPLGVDDIVSAAEAFVTHLELSDLTVIGHSMGGLVGLLFVERNPGLVRRFVNIEGNLGPEDCAIYSRRVFRQQFLGRARKFMDDLEEEMRQSGIAGFTCAADQLRKNVQCPAFFDYCRSIVDYSDHRPLRAEFLDLQLPKLYVHGSENVGLSHIPLLHEHGVQVCSVPEANHFPLYSNPDSVYAALVGFMRETG